MLKKSLLAFAVAFALSSMFSILSLMARLGFLTSISPSTVTGVSATAILTNAVFCLAALASFFVVFYFLAKMSQIKAGKATVFALLLGVSLGPIAIYQLLQLLPILYLNIASSLATIIFMYFLPALVALFFAKRREKD